MVTLNSGFKVLIIGSGVAGLSLAQILRKEGISCEVFERDDGSRSQGWSISLDQ
jgi:2-polyprenyl-6-methoxyphenol hydroxylase-like FAD-dependent oxidoreductase